MTTLEAKVLAGRWGVDWRAVLKWMQARGLRDLMDLRVFSMDHHEAMEKALADFWEFST